jgi:deoxyhypusine synthase
MEQKDKEKIARKNIFQKGESPKGLKIKGYDFNKGTSYKELIKTFSTTGFQASHLSKAINITNKMIKEDAKIYLGYTSNQVSSGNREIIRYLIEHKKVNVCVTTAGGIEEDIIKCLGNFVLGNFKLSGKELRKKGINRIGNILVSNELYCKFEEFMQPILEETYLEQKKGRIISASELVWKLGEKINNKKSICYWAWKNKIKIYCPAITDGALGDQIYFFKYKKPDFKLDVAEDIKEISDSTINVKKTGLIILGAGVIKHHILNANAFRNGADYAVYINNAQEFDGSDAGALPEEAISWGKLKPECESIKVYGDATILFPILVAETFASSTKDSI